MWLTMRKISTQELRKWFDSNQIFYLVDARSENTYQQEHIPKAISLPLGKVEHRHAQHFPNKSVQIVTYCTDIDCHASGEVGKKLEELGYENVLHYAEGIKEWKHANHPTESG
jgi:rhodanese-related sulfurtransferase